MHVEYQRELVVCQPSTAHLFTKKYPSNIKFHTIANVMVYIVDPNYCAVNVSYTESLPTMFTTNSVVVVPSISHTFQVFFFCFLTFHSSIQRAWGLCLHLGM